MNFIKYLLDYFKQPKPPINLNNQQVYNDALQIKNILKTNNYKIKKWIDTQNNDALFLCKEDEKPWKGIYLQTL